MDPSEACFFTTSDPPNSDQIIPGGQNSTVLGIDCLEDARSSLRTDEHIRLLQLFPLGLDRVAKFKFLNVSFEDIPAYNVLSYTWGAPSADPFDSPNGYQLTPNLRACLSELVVQLPGLWWIDALCINQDDPVEKNQQVRMMRKIYAKAHKLYIWLGPKGYDGQYAVDLLYKLQRLENSGAVTTAENNNRFQDENLKSLGLPEIESLEWRSLLLFINRPYFERIWVVQELAVSPENISVLCGNRIFPWKLLTSTLRFIDRQGWRSPLLNLAWEHNIATTVPAFRLIETTTILRYYTEKPLDLSFLLGLCRVYQSSDPRDKIIALLGLIPRSERVIKELRPDYGQPVVDYFQQITGALIIRQHSYDLLTWVEPRIATDDIDLPTWVPNYIKRDVNPYHANPRQVIPATAFNGEWISGSSTLCVHIKTLDKVEIVSPINSLPGTEPRAVIWSWLKLAAETLRYDVWDLLSHATSIEGPEPQVIDAFWRTLIGNQGAEAGDESNTPSAPDNYLWLFLGFLLGVLLREDNERSRGLIASWASNTDVGSLLQDPLEKGEHQIFGRQFVDSTLYNTFFITRDGRMGLGPFSIQSGDDVVLFSGGACIFFIRRKEAGYAFVGHGYVHGLMIESSLVDGPFQRVDLK